MNLYVCKCCFNWVILNIQLINNLEYNLVIILLGYPIVSSDCVESIINCIIMVNTLDLVRGAVVGKVVGRFWGTDMVPRYVVVFARRT